MLYITHCVKKCFKLEFYDFVLSIFRNCHTFQNNPFLLLFTDINIFIKIRIYKIIFILYLFV